MNKPVRAVCLAILLMLNGAMAGSAVAGFFSDNLTDAARYAFVPSRSEQKIVAIDTDDERVSKIFELTHIPGEIVVSQPTAALIATDPAASRMTRIDLDEELVEDSVALGLKPDSVLLSPSGLFVALGSQDGRVSLWDLKNYEEVFSLSDFESATRLTFSVDDAYLYLVEEQKKQISVIELSARKVVATIFLGGEVDANARVSELSRTADGHYGVLSVSSENRIVILDLSENRVIRSVTVGKDPQRPYSTADSRYILVPNKQSQSLTVLSALSYEIVTTIAVKVAGHEINTGWLETVAFVMPEEGDKVAVVDLEGLLLERILDFPAAVDNGLVISDTKKLLTAIADTGQVAVIETPDRSLRPLIDTGVKGLAGISIGISNNVCH